MRKGGGGRAAAGRGKVARYPAAAAAPIIVKINDDKKKLVGCEDSEHSRLLQASVQDQGDLSWLGRRIRQQHCGA